MQRREFIAAGAATAGSTLVAPRIARSQGARVLRFVPQSDIVGLDPVWTPTYPTRDHSLLVFDQLYGQDAQFRVQGQIQAAVRNVGQHQFTQ